MKVAIDNQCGLTDGVSKRDVNFVKDVLYDFYNDAGKYPSTMTRYRLTLENHNAFYQLYDPKDCPIGCLTLKLNHFNELIVKVCSLEGIYTFKRITVTLPNGSIRTCYQRIP